MFPVSDTPVDLFEEATSETDAILKNLGDIPIHLRCEDLPSIFILIFLYFLKPVFLHPTRQNPRRGTLPADLKVVQEPGGMPQEGGPPREAASPLAELALGEEAQAEPDR